MSQNSSLEANYNADQVVAKSYFQPKLKQSICA